MRTDEIAFKRQLMCIFCKGCRTPNRASESTKYWRSHAQPGDLHEQNKYQDCANIQTHGKIGMASICISQVTRTLPVCPRRIPAG